MVYYHAAASIAARAAGTAYVMIDPPATIDARVRRILVTADAATATSVGVIRTLTAGTVSASQAFDRGDSGRLASIGSTLSTTWSAQPTIAGTPLYLRKYLIPAVAGAGIEWIFDEWELVARDGATNQILIWNFGAATSSATQVSVTIEE